MSTKRFEIIKTEMICSWSYNLKKNNDCPICYNNLSASSVPCLQKGTDSSLRMGMCGHTFHSDCIGPWLRNNNRCPICSCNWEDQRVDTVSYTHLRAHETSHDLVCRLLL